jgi:hypothetical protein
MFSSDTRQRDRSLFVTARCKTRIIIPQITKTKNKTNHKNKTTKLTNNYPAKKQRIRKQ